MLQRRGLLPILLSAGLASMLLSLLLRDQWSTARAASRDLVSVVRWRAPRRAELDAACSLIREQVAAFRRGDYARARSLQSAALHRQWKSDTEFRRLIQTRYPEFAQSREVQFGPAQAAADGDIVQIPVRVTGSNGQTASALYILIREEGCYHVESVVGGAALPADPARTATEL